MEGNINKVQLGILSNQLKQLIDKLEAIDELISQEGLRNEQFVLDFYDKLNEISIRK